ncbi:hypothetical protein MRX96_038490 [Rhipicephalus microplus]
MDPERDAGRRAARAVALARQHQRDEGAVYVDAARYRERRNAFAAVVVSATTGKLLTASTVRARTAGQAEEAAIALATGGGEKIEDRCGAHTRTTKNADTAEDNCDYGPAGTFSPLFKRTTALIFLAFSEASSRRAFRQHRKNPTCPTGTYGVLPATMPASSSSQDAETPRREHEATMEARLFWWLHSGDQAGRDTDRSRRTSSGDRADGRRRCSAADERASPPTHREEHLGIFGAGGRAKSVARRGAEEAHLAYSTAERLQLRTVGPERWLGKDIRGAP